MNNNEEIAQHLQNHDIRPTAVRILIWRTLRELDFAFSMGDLEGRLPTVDRSTIFRALTLMVEHGLLHTLDDGSGEKKYCVCCEHEHCECEGHQNGGPCHCHDHEGRHLHEACEHVHLTCTVCGRTYCLKNQKIPQVAVPEGFVVEHIQYIIRGVCAKCSHRRS